MKFTRGKYPDIPGRPEYGDPCWRLTSKLINIDVDWNTRFPFGMCFGSNQGGAEPGKWKWSFCLDINAPLGEPNRFYLTTPRWFVILGLPAWRERIAGKGRWVRPHLDGVDRYRYHQDEAGKWKRNEKPEPWNWGWLAIERRHHG